MKISLAVAVALASVLPVDTGNAGEDASMARPDVKLTVSTHSGRMPLVLTLTADLPGVTAEQFEACYINVEWTYKTPGGQVFNSKKDLPCVDPEAEIQLPARFEKVLTLKEPGTYLYRIALQPREGRRQAFTTQEVTVYKGHWDVGASVVRVP